MVKSINIATANDTLQNNMCDNLHYVSSHSSTEEEATVMYEVDCDTIDLCSVTDEYAIIHTQEDFEPQASTSTSNPIPTTSHVKKCRKRSSDAYDGKNKLWTRYMETRNGTKYLEYCKSRNKLRALTRKLGKEFERNLANQTMKNPNVFWRYYKSKTTIKQGIGELNTYYRFKITNNNKK